MELNELLRILRRRWFVVLVVLAIVSAVGIRSAYRTTDHYQTTATLLVEPKVGNGNAQDVQFLLPGFAARLETRRLQQHARDNQLGFTEYKINTYGGVDVNANVQDGTNILRVTVRSKYQEPVAPMANALANELIDEQPRDSPAIISSLDEALPAFGPVPTDRNPMILGSIALGAILGLFAAIAIEMIGRRLDAATEIRSRFGASILGEIPSFRRLHRKPRSVRELLEAGKNPRAVEAFQALRTNLELVLDTRATTGFAVVSSGKGDGKSTVAASLGWVLASAGHSVTLIDGNLRNPSLHRQLEQRAGPGLSNVTADGIDDLARPTFLSSLSFVTAGTPERHPADVMRESLPHLVERYEQPGHLVIIDAPALRGAAETTLIATEAGAVILVVNARRYDPDEIEKALRELHDANSHVIGVVVTRTRKLRSRAAVPFRYGKRIKTRRFIPGRGNGNGNGHTGAIGEPAAPNGSRTAAAGNGASTSSGKQSRKTRKA